MAKFKKKTRKLNPLIIVLNFSEFFSLSQAYRCEFACGWPYLVPSMCCVWGRNERWVALLALLFTLDRRNDALLLESASSVSVWFWTCRTHSAGAKYVSHKSQRSAAIFSDNELDWTQQQQQQPEHTRTNRLKINMITTLCGSIACEEYKI